MTPGKILITLKNFKLPSENLNSLKKLNLHKCYNRKILRWCAVKQPIYLSAVKQPTSIKKKLNATEKPPQPLENTSTSPTPHQKLNLHEKLLKTSLREKMHPEKISNPRKN